MSFFFYVPIDIIKKPQWKQENRWNPGKPVRVHTEKVHVERASGVKGWERSADPAETKLIGQKMCPQIELDFS